MSENGVDTSITQNAQYCVTAPSPPDATGLNPAFALQLAVGPMSAGSEMVAKEGLASAAPRLGRRGRAVARSRIVRVRREARNLHGREGSDRALLQRRGSGQSTDGSEHKCEEGRAHC